ncbi:MAG: hypothetical protein EOO44_08140 [Flavobacterium sp.]|nr:MAG: hypothetical protein EOO44_08140 [Flavobacterium sp.]
MKQTFKLILITLFLFTFQAYSQDQECTLFFKDGDSIEGYGIIKNNKIKFRISLDSKADTWDFENVSKIEFPDFHMLYTYEYVKLNSFDNPKLLELVVDGEVKLYRLEKTLLLINMNPEFVDLQKGESILSKHREPNKQTTEVFYLKRKNDEYPTHINIGILSNWKKVTTTYFSDCDFLVKKIKDNKYTSNQINEIVEFYNDICRE